MAFNAKQVKDLNREDRASQNIQLGTFLNNLFGSTGSAVNITGGSISGISYPISTKNSSYTILPNDQTILCDSTSGSMLINLPLASSVSGHIYNIKKIDSTFNNIIIDGNGSETIDGDLTKTIGNQWTSVTIQSNGSAWYII